MLTVRKHVLLAPYTTLGLGGPARYFVDAHDEVELRASLTWAGKQDVPWMVLGGGSNLVVSDAGFEGLVVRMRTRGIVLVPAASDQGMGGHLSSSIVHTGQQNSHQGGSGSNTLDAGLSGGDRAGDGLEEGAVDGALDDRGSPRGEVLVRVAAGEPWDAFVARCCAAGWAGVECLSGIPGSVGATPIQNVGAYGQEVADTIAEVRVLEVSTLQERVFEAAECGFGYRHSRFKGADAGRFVVLDVTFRLKPGGAPTLRYAELRARLASAEAQGCESLASGGDTSSASPSVPMEKPPGPSLQMVREHVLALRRSKAMVLDPDEPNSRSAGSFFTNPVVAVQQVEAIADRARARGVLREGETVPAHPAGPGQCKLSAAWLIERAGFAKGYGEGPVGLSQRHTLALVNRGGATAADVLAFMRHIQHGVEQAFHVKLVPEPQWVGPVPSD